MAGISADIFAREVIKALKEYSQEEANKVNKIAKEVANDAKDDLMLVSPRRTERYRFSWAVNPKNTVSYSRSFIIHNKRYRITHLLEYGHAIRSGTGRVPPKEHIAPVEKEAVARLIGRLEAEL